MPRNILAGPRVSLMPATVDAYWINLDDAEQDTGALARMLSDEERARAARFRFERDRRHYILRHAHLRKLLSTYVGDAPEKIVFVYNAFGKPSVRGSVIHFNTSHSRGMALFVISRGSEVGCDIEQCDPQFASERIPEQFFAAGEVTKLRSLPPEQQTQAFFRCWTRKEAYVKARGQGLSIALDSFEVSLTPGEPVALLNGCDGWSVRSFAPVSGYAAAVVAEGAGWQLNHLPLAA
jgi:4'-phosphopantetheinyl transferase